MKRFAIRSTRPTAGFYEVLPHIQDESGEVTLVASYTANNGIRIGLLDNDSEDQNWRDFDFTDEQAETIGRALLRWAHRRRLAERVIKDVQP